MQHVLTSETLPQLDGGAAGAIIDAAIREAVSDLEDRGDDGKPRKVEITLTFTGRDDGLVETDVEAAARLPRRRTAQTIARPKRDAAGSRLFFQGCDPTDPDQRTLDEAEQENKGE